MKRGRAGIDSLLGLADNMLSRRLARARVLLPLLKAGRELDARASSAQDNMYNLLSRRRARITLCLPPRRGKNIIGRMSMEQDA